MNLKLPVFKVTERSPSGVVHRNVPRGKKSVDRGRNDDSSVAKEADCVLDPPDSDPSFTEPILEPSLDDVGDDDKNVSLYMIKQKASTSAWASIRQGLLKTAVENSAMPINQQCIMCCCEAVYRCVQCLPCGYYCHDCFGQAHMKVNIFHTGEVWQVNKFNYALAVGI